MIEEKVNIRKEYKMALKKSDKLAVHANRFRKSKFLLLFTVLEKNESTSEGEDGEEDHSIIGSMDNTARKNIMTLCHNAIRSKKIGPRSKSSFNAPEKMDQVIIDISELRKHKNPNWLAQYYRMK